MASFCKKLCCLLFCCRCAKKNHLKEIDDDTRLLPKNERTRGILEKDELNCFGVVPELIRGQVIDISKYTRATVKKIVCGMSHCLILFNDGQLAGFGSNDQGQLGYEINKNEENNISEIKINRLFLPQGIGAKYDIFDIAAGDYFSFLLVRAHNKNMLFRIGLLEEDKYKDHIDKANIITPIEIDVKIGFVKNIYAFGSRVILLNTNNEIYVGGVDFDKFPLNKFKFIDRLTKEIKGIYLGLEHCLILDVSGGLFVIGDNTYGELGFNDISNIDKLTRFSHQFNNGNIKKVAVGARHSLVLLDNGELYTFGDNSEGQCTGFHTRYSTPFKVEFETKEKIVDVYSGYNHNIIILSNGEMYSWGDASSGKLGYIEGNLSINAPKLIQCLKGKFCNSLALGQQMTVISTSNAENSLNNKSA